MSKKILILSIIASFLFAGLSYAESKDKRIVLERIVDRDGDDTINLGSAITLYTKSFSLRSTENVGVMYQATSDTLTPQISFYLEQSYERPTAEGVADFEYVVTEILEEDRVDHRWGVATLDSLAPLPFARFKLVGGSSNPTDTVIQIRVGKQ